MRQTAPPVQAEPSPLNETELREILQRLFDLGTAWSEVDALRAAIQQIEAINTRERDIAARELTAEQDRVTLAKKEAEIANEKAAFFEQALKAATQKKQCRLKKILTLGLGRCG